MLTFPATIEIADQYDARDGRCQDCRYPIHTLACPLCFSRSIPWQTGSARVSVNTLKFQTDPLPAVRSLAQSFAAELIGRGVRVNAISPGGTDTGIIAKRFSPDQAKAVMERLKTTLPIKRLAQPEEIAVAIGSHHLTVKRLDVTSGGVALQGRFEVVGMVDGDQIWGHDLLIALGMAGGPSSSYSRTGGADFDSRPRKYSPGAATSFTLQRRACASRW